MSDRLSKSCGKWLVMTILVLTSAVLPACSRPNPTPEVLDPIYADLNQRSALAKSAAESAKAEVKKLQEELINLPARDITRKKTQQDLSKKEMQIMVAEQEALYYEIRAEQRKKYARQEYLKAFEKGEAWPDPKDFETYKTERKLRDAPREWSNKIPKTDRYNRKSPEDMRKELDEKLKASSGGGGGH